MVIKNYTLEVLQEEDVNLSDYLHEIFGDVDSVLSVHSTFSVGHNINDPLKESVIKLHNNGESCKGVFYA